MSEQNIKKMIGKAFLDIAEGIESEDFGKKYVIGIAADGSEHGEETFMQAAALAEAKGLKPLLIKGENTHDQMEEMLRTGEIDGAVTMHYPFPIGVSTVGKIVTPAKGRTMYIATTTGTSDTDRISAMVKNAVYGIIAAKADGLERPTVGIANIDGARQCEKALLKLKDGGYDIEFASSARADGGIVMRGNDLLQGSADVMVMDSLTGNLMIKIFSSFTSGGGYEYLGWGYGPGIGEGFDKVILIISRASGAPLIAGAVEYASNLIANGMTGIAKREFKAAKKAGLDDILKELSQPKAARDDSSEEVKIPPAEVVTEQIPGIEVMDLDDAVEALWKEDIYAESGMGCTGPIIRISQANKDKALKILADRQYI
ncbi:glycine/sarcosine/betaine reductase complex component C subunit alpha [Gallibacter sp. Marseille-QA0791]|uniref:glycine/sarcosine/betaine reductase complex component C subunit alpha n=1 Tax=Gallibacter sp. Marseille-QA0791 TaxID=3378781 RepID=UPI003D14C80A